MRDVLSGVAKNGMGCFVPGCFVLHSEGMHLSSIVCAGAILKNQYAIVVPPIV